MSCLKNYIKKKAKIPLNVLQNNIRFDFTLRIANTLDIDVNEVCFASPFSGAI